jgi:PPM family protein phosphatase
MVLPRRRRSPRLTIASFTERGPHPENEDAFEVSRHPADPSTVLCVLADGQGGRRGGARAARLACAVARDAAAATAPRRLLSPRVWRRIARRVDASVARDPHAGLTTFVGLVIRGARLVGVSNGDSAVVVRSGTAAVAELTAGQSKHPPVGSGNAALVPFSASLSEPWSVVAMSDGVWHRSGRQAMLDRVATQQGEALIRALTAAARTAGHDHYPDDVTVVVVDGAGDRKR